MAKFTALPAVVADVPKLRGKTLAKSTTLLSQQARQAGHVLKTRFKAGTRHPAGTRIRVTVARRV
jgi:hypothetical protein